MNELNIWQLQEYAQQNGGYDSGRFIALTRKGIFEFKWLDAYFGFIQLVQPEQDGFVDMKTLREFFGDEQKYVPTIGYNNKED